MKRDQKNDFVTYSAPETEVFTLETESCFATSPGLEDIGGEKDEIEW